MGAIHVLQQLTTEPVDVYLPPKVGPLARATIRTSNTGNNKTDGWPALRKEVLFRGGCCGRPALASLGPLTRASRARFLSPPACPQVVRRNWYGFLSWVGRLGGVSWRDCDEYAGDKYDLVRGAGGGGGAGGRGWGREAGLGFSGGLAWGCAVGGGGWRGRECKG